MSIYYDNQAMRQHATRMVASMSVKDIYKPLLVDILLRRAKEFNLSDAEFKRDVTTLVRNLRKIEIENPNIMTKSFNGYYMPFFKKIAINKKRFKTSDVNYERIYETLTHEVYHVLATDQDGNDIMTSVNRINGEPNTTLREEIVSSASTRVVQSRNDFVNSRIAYGRTKFSLDLIAATYGITEKELLDRAIRGKESLRYNLSMGEHKAPHKTGLFLDAMELNLNRLHNVFYSRKFSKSQDRSEQISEITDSLIGMFTLAESHINWMAKREGFLDLKKREDYRFRLARIDNILERVLNEYSDLYHYDFRREVYKGIDNDVLLNANLYDKTEQFRRMSRPGRYEERLQPDYYYNEGWDNSKIIAYIKKYIEPEAKKRLLSRPKHYSLERLHKEIEPDFNIRKMGESFRERIRWTGPIGQRSRFASIRTEPNPDRYYPEKHNRRSDGGR